MTSNLPAEHASDLRKLGREINLREQAIERLKNEAVSKANDAVAEALLQGQDLIKAKSEVPSKLWDDWLATHCPRVQPGAAKRYMTVASKLPRTGELNPTGSLQMLLAFFSTDSPITKRESPHWAADLLGIARFSKGIDILRDNPLTTWPAASVDQLREDLEPVAKQLWPNRFA